MIFESIRTFGFDRHEFPTMVDNVAALMRFIAINIDEQQKKRVPIICSVMMLVSFGCFFYAYQVSGFVTVFYSTAAYQDKIIAFSQSSISIVTATKYLYIYWNRNELKRIVSAYLLSHSTVVPHSRMSRHMDLTLRAVKQRALVLWLVVAANTILYVVVRPLVFDRDSLADYVQMWGLEPMFESPNFEISFTIISTSMPLLAVTPIHLTIFRIVIVGYTEAQMLALAEELLNLWEDCETDYLLFSEENKTQTSIDDLVKCRLENIIKYHAQNKQLIQYVEDTFRNITTLQFIAVSVALVANLVAGWENTYSLIPFTMLLVGMDCFTGQNLMYASAAFETAVYRCKWEKFSKDNMKAVLMMLQSAQKTMKLTAGGVACLDYACFMNMVKTIYSIYAALR